MSRSCKTEEVEHWATITQRGRVGTESHGDLLLHVQPAANEFAGRPRAHTQASGRHTRSSRTCGRETDRVCLSAAGSRASSVSARRLGMCPWSPSKLVGSRLHV